MSKATLREERAAKAAAQLAAQKRAERKRTFIAIGGVVLAMAIIIGGGVWLGQRGGGSDPVDKSGVPAIGKTKYGLTIGKPSAPHKVIIYEDFLCPICGAFEAEGHEKLAKLADEGKVYIDYRPFQLRTDWTYSRQALNAFAVVRKTAGDEVAKKFHDLLYANQPNEAGPFPPVSSLVTLAVQAGAEKSKVEKDILDTESQASYVDGATKQAEDDAGVQGTPTILLDGTAYQKGSGPADWADNLVKDLS